MASSSAVTSETLPADDLAALVPSPPEATAEVIKEKKRTLEKFDSLSIISNIPLVFTDCSAGPLEKPRLLYSLTHTLCSSSRIDNRPTDRPTTAESMLKSFLAGGFGGVCVVLTGHPLDLIKVRTCLHACLLEICRAFCRAFFSSHMP